MRIKDDVDYAEKIPDILSEQELVNDNYKNIEYFYKYKALYYWIDPYDCGETGYYLIAYANSIKKLEEYCHAQGYKKDSNVHCINGYEIVDIEKSFQQGKKVIVDK